MNDKHPSQLDYALRRSTDHGFTLKNVSDSKVFGDWRHEANRAPALRIENVAAMALLPMVYEADSWTDAAFKPRSDGSPAFEHGNECWSWRDPNYFGGEYHKPHETQLAVALRCAYGADSHKRACERVALNGATVVPKPALIDHFSRYGFIRFMDYPNRLNIGDPWRKD